MKRQIITAVSRLTVLVFATFSLCGCETWFETPKSPMTVSLSNDYAGEVVFYSDVFLKDLHPTANNFIEKGSDNTINISMHRNMENKEPLYSFLKLGLYVQCEDEELQLSKKYPLEITAYIEYAKPDDGRYLIYIQSNNMSNGWIEFSKSVYKDKGDRYKGGYWGRTILDGKFEYHYIDAEGIDAKFSGKFSDYPVYW